MRTKSTRYSAAALAALCLLAPILGYAHMLMVRHATCPEHGELIHVDEVAHAPTLGDRNSPSGTAIVVGERPQELESDEHHHCVAVHARKTQAALASTGVALSAASATLQPVDQGAVAYAPIPLFRLAPKNSPPA